MCVSVCVVYFVFVWLSSTCAFGGDVCVFFFCFCMFGVVCVVSYFVSDMSV